MEQPLDVDEIRERAFQLLARREHSEFELKAKLLARGAGPEPVERVLESLKSNDILSDRRFTESLVRIRMERGYGPLKIRHELSAKGVAQELIDAALDNNPGKWEKLLENAWEKKFKGHKPQNYKQWTNQARFLQGRGFTTEQIRKMLPYANSL